MQRHGNSGVFSTRYQYIQMQRYLKFLQIKNTRCSAFFSERTKKMHKKFRKVACCATGWRGSSSNAGNLHGKNEVGIAFINGSSERGLREPYVCEGERGECYVEGVAEYVFRRHCGEARRHDAVFFFVRY